MNPLDMKKRYMDELLQFSKQGQAEELKNKFAEKPPMTMIELNVAPAETESEGEMVSPDGMEPHEDDLSDEAILKLLGGPVDDEEEKLAAIKLSTRGGGMMG